MQVLAFNSRVVLRPTVRLKIKRRLKEAVRLIVTRGATVEGSRSTGPKIVFRAEDVGADKWIAPGVLLLLSFHAAAQRLVVRSFFLAFIAHDGPSHADWTYVALPTSEMFCMPLAELVNSMRQALVFLRRCIPEAERALRHSGGENGGVRCQKLFLRSTCTATDFEFSSRMGRLGTPKVRAKIPHPGSFDRFANATSPFTAECKRMTEYGHYDG